MGGADFDGNGVDDAGDEASYLRSDLLLRWAGESIASEISDFALARGVEAADDATEPRAVVVPTTYDGADLEDVARQLANAALLTFPWVQ